MTEFFLLFIFIIIVPCYMLMNVASTYDRGFKPTRAAIIPQRLTLFVLTIRSVRCIHLTGKQTAVERLARETRRGSAT